MKKQLEIELSKIIDDFKEPKIKFEQYMTPPEIAAFMIHYAWMKGEIENKKIIDIGAGTGMLGIGAAFLGGNVTCLLYTSPSPRDVEESRMPSSA